MAELPQNPNFPELDTTEIDFAELSQDSDLVSQVTDLDKALKVIHHQLEEAISLKDSHYDELAAAQRIELDTYLMYAVNSMVWIHLRLIGRDPSKHEVKDQLGIVRDLMKTYKQAVDSKTIRPKIDKPAAERFIRHGIKEYKKREEGQESITKQPFSKKTKFNENGEVQEVTLHQIKKKKVNK